MNELDATGKTGWNEQIMIRNPSAATRWTRAVLLLALLAPVGGWAAEDPALLDIERKVTHGYATNGAVRIHYAQLGQGPLVVKVKCPVLMIHGLKDKALGRAALNGNWDYVEQDLTLVTVPDADHWVQQDTADLVTRTIMGWLHR